MFGLYLTSEWNSMSAPPRRWSYVCILFACVYLYVLVYVYVCVCESFATNIWWNKMNIIY